MEILVPTEACFAVDDDLLNFTLDGEEVDEELQKTVSEGGASASSSSLGSSNTLARTPFRLETQNDSFPVIVEEELEWLSNKDAFPALETCFGILADNPELLLKTQSPTSVLENSSSSSNSSDNVSTVASCCRSLKVPVNYPVRARSKRRRSKRRAGFGELLSQHLWLGQVNVMNKQELSYSSPPLPIVAASGMGRRCLHCQADKTPQWRAGPMGPKTLCNACGVRYKSGRLLPEYRPANSPTFVSTVHSNSHRKVVEMRKQKQIGTGTGTGTGTGGGGIVGNEACG